MLWRRFTDYILQSRLQAMLVAFVSAFIPLIGSISIIIAALVTLRKGTFEGALVAIAATIPYLITYAVYPSAEHAGLAVFAIWIMLISNVLTWLFAILLRRYNNWSFTLELAAYIGIVTVVLVHLFYPDIQAWWAARLNNYFDKTNALAGEIATNGEAITKEIQATTVNYLKQFATGLTVVSVLTNALLQLGLARWWQAAMFNPGGLRKELLNIQLSTLLVVLFVITVGLSYLDYPISFDIMPVLCAAFGIAGLSLIHFALASKSWVWILLLYAIIIWLIPISIGIIAMLAIFDTLLDFRKKLRKSSR